MNETKLFVLVTGTEMEPWLSRNMLPNVNTCENGWSNFSAKSESCVIKIAELSIRITKSINLLQFLMCCSSRWRHREYSSYEATCYVLFLAMTSSRVLVLWGHLLCAVPRDDVIESTRVMRPPVMCCSSRWRHREYSSYEATCYVLFLAMTSSRVLVLWGHLLNIPPSDQVSAIFFTLVYQPNSHCKFFITNIHSWWQTC